MSPFRNPILDPIVTLWKEYPKAELLVEGLSAHSVNPEEIVGFVGSKNALFLSSSDSLTFESPACIAAPLVTLVAENEIKLGVAGRGQKLPPVRLCASQQLLITTNHLSIGDVVMIIPESQRVFISCKKLTLSKSTKEDPPHFELIKSLIINDDVEVEIKDETVGSLDFDSLFRKSFTYKDVNRFFRNNSSTDRR